MACQLPGAIPLSQYNDVSGRWLKQLKFSQWCYLDETGSYFEVVDDGEVISPYAPNYQYGTPECEFVDSNWEQREEGEETKDWPIF